MIIEAVSARDSFSTPSTGGGHRTQVLLTTTLTLDSEKGFEKVDTRSTCGVVQLCKRGFTVVSRALLWCPGQHVVSMTVVLFHGLGQPSEANAVRYSTGLKMAF